MNSNNRHELLIIFFSSFRALYWELYWAGCYPQSINKLVFRKEQMGPTWISSWPSSYPGHFTLASPRLWNLTCNSYIHSQSCTEMVFLLCLKHEKSKILSFSVFPSGKIEEGIDIETTLHWGWKSKSHGSLLPFPLLPHTDFIHGLTAQICMKGVEMQWTQMLVCEIRSGLN